MKNLAALAFLPERHVIEEFNRIKEDAEDSLDGKDNLFVLVEIIFCFSVIFIQVF